MCIDDDNMDQESVSGEYVSTDIKFDVPSSPPTAYRQPFTATTPGQRTASGKGIYEYRARSGADFIKLLLSQML